MEGRGGKKRKERTRSGAPNESSLLTNPPPPPPAFNEFIHERERTPPSDPAVRLFDEIILAKKARGRPALSAGLSRLSTLRVSHGIGPAPGRNPFGSAMSAASVATGAATMANKIPSFLSDTSDHIWRTASVPVPSSRFFHGDYRAVVTRVPLRLDPALMREPRTIQGVPRPEQGRVKGLVRKQVASMLGPPAGGDFNVG